MGLGELKEFLMWCTILNGGLLFLWSGLFLFASDLLYRTQKRWFKGTRKEFEVAFYGFLGIFKILVIILNLVPFLALSIMG